MIEPMIMGIPVQPVDCFRNHCESLRALFLEVLERLGLILLQELVRNHLRLTEVSFAPEGLGGSGFAWQKRRVAELLYYETCNLKDNYVTW